MKTKIFTQENYKNDCSFVSTKLDKKGNPEKLYTDESFPVELEKNPSLLRSALFVI